MLIPRLIVVAEVVALIQVTQFSFGDTSVVEKDGALAIVQGSKNKPFPMEHYDRDIFTYQTEEENAVGRSGITFTIGPDAKATQVVVENLNVHGEGTFKRIDERK